MVDLVHDRFVRVAAIRDLPTDGIAFYIARREVWPDQPVPIRQYGRVEMRPVEEGDEAMYRPPTFWLSMEQATNLMNDLWAAGIRPDDFGEPAGALAPMQAHLDDARAWGEQWSGLANALLERILGEYDNS